MAEHKLATGKAWIAALVALGEALRYHVELEYDVFKREDREGPVDVAWFRSKRDRFPLFIFEVETIASAQLGHNAGKVFSQETKDFEKPLFHFHLVVEGAKNNAKVDVAEANYGKFNYRVYGVLEGEATAALEDVIAEHRRVSEDLDVGALAAALAAHEWPTVDRQSLWSYAEAQGFSASWLRTYAELSLIDPEQYLPRLLAIVERGPAGALAGDRHGYQTFLGAWCAEPIHAAIRCEAGAGVGAELLAELQAWQDNGGGMKTAAPHPGLSEDGDHFVFALMPAIWALLAGMFSEVEGARRWILEQMALVVERDGLRPFAFAATAIWMLHVAAAGEDREYFDIARGRLNSEGGISAALLAEPPAVGGMLADADTWWERLESGKVKVPELEEFRERFGGTRTLAPDGWRLGLPFLIEDVLPDGKRAAEIRDLLYT
jgi:hypothetical protein